MNFNSIHSRETGLQQQDGPIVLNSKQMSHAKFTKKFTLQRILVHPGNSLRITFLNSHGDLLESQTHRLSASVKLEKTNYQIAEFSLLMTQI